MERQILHIDVNNAFLSWSAIERLKNGEQTDIRKIPSAICGDENRRSGIILAKSQLAKSMGVVTGETIYQAVKKCPNLKTFPTDFKAYRRYSDALYNLLLEYSYKVERFSVDECFVDMTTFLMGSTLLEKAKEINEKNDELSNTYGGNFAFVKTYQDLTEDEDIDQSVIQRVLRIIYEEIAVFYNREIFLVQGKKNFVDSVKLLMRNNGTINKLLTGVDNFSLRKQIKKILKTSCKQVVEGYEMLMSEKTM